MKVVKELNGRKSKVLAFWGLVWLATVVSSGTHFGWGWPGVVGSLLTLVWVLWPLVKNDAQGCR